MANGRGLRRTAGWRRYEHCGKDARCRWRGERRLVRDPLLYRTQVETPSQRREKPPVRRVRRPTKASGSHWNGAAASGHMACTTPNAARRCRTRLLAATVGRFRNKNASASGKARLGQDDRQPASGDRAWIEQASPVSTEDAPFLWSAPQQPIGTLFPLLLQNLEIINANGMPFSVLTFPHHQIFPCIALPADAALPTLIWRKLAPALCAGKRQTCHPDAYQPNRYGY